MPFLIRVHYGHQVVLALGDHPVNVTAQAAAPAADLDDVELVASALGGEEVGDRKDASSGDSTSGQRGALEEGATVKCRIHS
jgi:hypothetical protein